MCCCNKAAISLVSHDGCGHRGMDVSGAVSLRWMGRRFIVRHLMPTDGAPVVLVCEEAVR
jgi:hypothetical protein